jgi:hypothetical protein
MTVGAALPGTPARNGRPPFRPYRRGAPRPAWMRTALAAAEAEHGPPVPTCLCGGTLDWRQSYGVCPACGRGSGTNVTPIRRRDF